MTFPTKSKPWSQRPNDHGGGEQTAQWMDWATSAINQLIGQANAPPQTGLTSLQTNVIDPTSGQISSAGSRMSSVTTAIKFTTTATTVSFFWDGSNNSKPFTIYRDDGSTVGPIVAGSGLTVTGLTNLVTYFFYAYWDEITQSIQFVSLPGCVGTPPIAFTAVSAPAVQQQILRGRIPIAPLMATTGIPIVAGGSGDGGSGGGGGGGNFGGLLP